jgi:hypothetical protein
MVLPEGGEVTGRGPDQSIPSLGLLTGPMLLSMATEENGLGAPPNSYADTRGCPGEDRPVFMGASGDMFLRKGRLCGLLVTGGDLWITGDASFQGLALVGGDLTLENRANFEGLAGVRNRFFHRDDASFHGSACAVLRALSQIPSLQKPVLLKTAIGIDPL